MSLTIGLVFDSTVPASTRVIDLAIALLEASTYDLGADFA